MSDLYEHHKREAANLDPEIREASIILLRKEIPESELQSIKKDAEEDLDWAIPHHFHWGMAVRNLLRRVAKDDQLPSGNWDDYYVLLVEVAAGVER